MNFHRRANHGIGLRILLHKICGNRRKSAVDPVAMLIMRLGGPWSLKNSEKSLPVETVGLKIPVGVSRLAQYVQTPDNPSGLDSGEDAGSQGSARGAQPWAIGEIPFGEAESDA